MNARELIEQRVRANEGEGEGKSDQALRKASGALTSLRDTLRDLAISLRSEGKLKQHMEIARLQHQCDDMDRRLDVMVDGGTWGRR
jgi:hypothetical protein